MRGLVLLRVGEDREGGGSTRGRGKTAEEVTVGRERVVGVVGAFRRRSSSSRNDGLSDGEALAVVVEV